jgi:hypothetical protein
VKDAVTTAIAAVELFNLNHPGVKAGYKALAVAAILATVKHPGFSEEREWRLITALPRHRRRGLRPALDPHKVSSVCRRLVALHRVERTDGCGPQRPGRAWRQSRDPRGSREALTQVSEVQGRSAACHHPIPRLRPSRPPAQTLNGTLAPLVRDHLLPVRSRQRDVPFGVCSVASRGVVRSECSVSVVGQFFCDDLDVERFMEWHHKGHPWSSPAWRRMARWRGSAAYATGIDHPAVDVEAAFDCDDGVCGEVCACGRPLNARWVADHVVFLARRGVLVKQCSPIGCRRRPPPTQWVGQLERSELVDDHSGSKSSPTRSSRCCTRAHLPEPPTAPS